MVFRPAGTRGLDGGPDPARITVAHHAGSCAHRAVGAGRARDRAYELYRNDCCRPRLCSPWRSSDQCQPRTGRHRGGQSRRRAARGDAGRWRHLSDCGCPRCRRPIAEGVAGHGGHRGGDHAAAGTLAGFIAKRDAGSGRHCLLGWADPASGIPYHSQSTHDGVSLGDHRRARRAAVRHAEGHRGGDHCVADRAIEPGRLPARVRDWPQARS